MHSSLPLLGALTAVATLLASPPSILSVTELPWRVVNDTVMGGVSQGRVQVAQTVRFDGVLSLEQNGGFASVRASLPPGALEGATDLRVVVRGDGRTWGLTLRRDDVPLRAGSYRAPVPTQEGQTTVTVPLASFRPTSFGRPVPGAPALDSDLGQVDGIGFLLADKNPGPFALEVVEVQVVRDTARTPPDRGLVRAALATAIERGVPMFNRGDIAGCRDTYAAALGGLVDGTGLTPGERSLVAEALVDATSQAPRDAAWTLRYAIDSVLRGI